MRQLFLVVTLLLASSPLSANDRSYVLLQSGSINGPTPLFDHGLHGEGEIIAVLDTGADYDSCYLSGVDGPPPPTNTVEADGSLAWSAVDRSRKKIVAYDLLYSCAEWPGAPGCEFAGDPGAYDNQGHGTHAATAAAGDRGSPLFHDFGDGVAPGAKLVVQDAGFIGGDNCTQRPGLGCPTRDLAPILEQAWKQGARIHSNSWGDRQGVPSPIVPPTANYSAGAAEIDDFVWNHPSMVVIFNSGNAGLLGPSSVSAPGVAKNGIQVGGAEFDTAGQLAVSDYSGRGPARDGRIKPDLIGPDVVTSGDTDGEIGTGNCNASIQPGTSWSAPTVAGAAALVRQYYRDGFYPDGSRGGTGFEPSAALVKATLIASARAIGFETSGEGTRTTPPPPSTIQGFGIPVLDSALYFAGDKQKLRVVDFGPGAGVAAGESFIWRILVQEPGAVRVVLVWTDPAATPRGTTDPSPVLVHDLDLVVETPSGQTYLGNDSLHPGAADRVNNVEEITIASPETGIYEIRVRGANVGAGQRQSFAVVITGSVAEAGRRRPARPSAKAGNVSGDAHSLNSPVGPRIMSRHAGS